MRVGVENITVPSIKRILQAWVEVGGLDPQMEAHKIAGAIRKVVETGDSTERFQLDDGYRFGSKVGSSKLYFRVRGGQVDIGMHANSPFSTPAKEQEADDVCRRFQEKLREIFV